MDSKFSKTKNELTSLKGKNDELNKLVSEISIQLKQYQKSQLITNTEKDYLQKKLTDLENKYQSLINSKDNNELLKKHILELSCKMEKYKKLLETTNTEKSQLDKILADLENKYKESKKTVTQLQKLNYETITENVNLDLAIKSLEDQLREKEDLYKQNLHKLQKKPGAGMKDAEIQCDTLHDKVQQLEEKYALMKHVAASRGKEIEKLKLFLNFPLDKECV